MDIQEFSLIIQNQFTDSSVRILPDTDFRNNDEFDSLIGMAILITIKETFGYEMTVPEFLECHTPSDLYKKIMKNK